MADAGPLFAVTDDRDQYHPRAQGDLDRLTRERRPIVIPNPVLYECYSLILRHHSPSGARSWLDEIRAATFFMAPNAEDHVAAMQRISLYRDQSITLFDAILAVMSERLNLPVWTFDHHFDVMRVSVWR